MKPIVLSMIDNEVLTEELLLCAKEHHPEVEWVLPENPLARQAKIAACWYPPSTILKDYPELTCLYSVGAGVDNLGDFLVYCFNLDCNFYSLPFSKCWAIFSKD